MRVINCKLIFRIIHSIVVKSTPRRPPIAHVEVQFKVVFTEAAWSVSNRSVIRCTSQTLSCMCRRPSSAGSMDRGMGAWGCTKILPGYETTAFSLALILLWVTTDRTVATGMSFESTSIWRIRHWLACLTCLKSRTTMGIASRSRGECCVLT